MQRHTENKEFHNVGFQSHFCYDWYRQDFGSHLFVLLMIVLISYNVTKSHRLFKRIKVVDNRVNTCNIMTQIITIAETISEVQFQADKQVIILKSAHVEHVTYHFSVYSFSVLLHQISGLLFTSSIETKITSNTLFGMRKTKCSEKTATARSTSTYIHIVDANFSIK